MTYFCRDLCRDWRRLGFSSYEECIKWCLGEETSHEQARLI